MIKLVTLINNKADVERYHLPTFLPGPITYWKSWRVRKAPNETAYLFCSINNPATSRAYGRSAKGVHDGEI